LLGGALALVLLAGCARVSPSSAELVHRRIYVTATFGMIADIVQNVIIVLLNKRLIAAGSFKTYLPATTCARLMAAS
jgi:ABC-type Zn uptake system ZnuABC Zn-binding protein ZnuA